MVVAHRPLSVARPDLGSAVATSRLSDPRPAAMHNATLERAARDGMMGGMGANERLSRMDERSRCPIPSLLLTIGGCFLCLGVCVLVLGVVVTLVPHHIPTVAWTLDISIHGSYKISAKALFVIGSLKLSICWATACLALCFLRSLVAVFERGFSLIQFVSGILAVGCLLYAILQREDGYLTWSCLVYFCGWFSCYVAYAMRAMAERRVAIDAQRTQKHQRSLNVRRKDGKTAQVEDEPEANSTSAP